MNETAIYKKATYLGLIIMLIAFVFAVTETIYFGYNLFPKTDGEILCDYISAYVYGGGQSLVLWGVLNKAYLDYKEITKCT